MMADLAKIKRNVAKMAGMNAPEADIDGYIASEGATIDQVRNFKIDATPPSGLPGPGSREYADWAVQQARAGSKLPAISNPDPQPAWGPPGAIVPVQFQNGTGQHRWAMPSMITDAVKAFQAPGDALAGNYNQVEMNPQTGAVDPFDANLIPAAASMAGMFTPTGVASRVAEPIAAATGGALKRAATPSIDDLYATKDAAYVAANKLGAKFSQDAIDALYGDMVKRSVTDSGTISPTIHPKAYSFLADHQSNPRAMSLTQLDELRQEIRRDLVKSGDGGEAHYGQKYIDAIDHFIENADPSHISGVTGQTASFAIKAARKANTTLRKAETLDDAMANARLNAGKSGSGGNVDNAIRNEIAKILKSPEKVRSFTPEEQAMMDKVVMGGGKIDHALRTVAKLSPSGNGLMAALGIGATATNPLMAAVPIAGILAKAVQEQTRQRSIDALTNAVRTASTAGKPIRSVRPALPLIPQTETTLTLENLLREGPAALPIGKLRIPA